MGDEVWDTWATEAAMVADFTAWAQHCGWIAYAETAGWDLLLVRPADGFQIGVEAKLRLNVEVLCQAVGRESRWDRGHGPDCRAILAPRPKTQNGIPTLARQLGVVVIAGSAPNRHRWRAKPWSGPEFSPELPEIDKRFVTTDDEMASHGWPELCPDQRCKLPDYVPDVTGGHSAPVALTPWKVQAIKAAIILETVGYITRADFKALKIDPSRWTQFWLRSAGDRRWVATTKLPNFKVQHPLNYEQIKADLPKWRSGIPSLDASQPLGDAA